VNHDLARAARGWVITFTVSFNLLSRGWRGHTPYTYFGQDFYCQPPEGSTFQQGVVFSIYW
jgi:hypothetical protein